MKRLIYIFLIIFGFGGPSAMGQEMKAIVSLERDSILIGDQIKLNIRLLAKAETKIAWPKIEEFLVPRIEVLSRSAIDSSLLNNNELELTQNLVITSFDTGYYQIPGLEFTYQNKGEEAFLKSKSNELELYVLTLSVDTTQAIMPIKGPISAPYTWQEIAPWLALGLIVIGMTIFLVYYFRKKEKHEPVFKPKSKPKIAPHIVALSDLENLKAKKLWQEGRFKEYYTILIDIIRVYLEDQFGIEAMEMTSDEIKSIVSKDKTISKELKLKLSEALDVSDLVKFAKEKPLASINDISLANLVDFVDKTHEIKNVGDEENSDQLSPDETSIKSLKDN